MRWRWILGIVAAGLMLFVIGVYVIASSYDYNDLKPHIAQLAKQATGRELTLDGDIDFKLGLTPALVVENVRFQNAAWGSQPDLATVKRLEVQIALLSLLRGNFEVKRLVLIEPMILLETDNAGKSNLAFDTPKEQAKAKTQRPALAVNDVRLENGQFTFKDGRSGQTYTVMLDTLTATAAAGLDSPLNIALQGAYHDQPFKTVGSLGPLTLLMTKGNAWPLHLTTDISGATFTVDGTVQDPFVPRGIELNLTANGKDLKTLQALIGTPFPLQGPFRFSGRAVDAAPKTYEIFDLKATLGADTLNGTIKVNLTGTRPHLTATLSSSRLDLRQILPQHQKPSTKKTKFFLTIRYP
ncbi:MAG: AsmA family protein [Candidatus Tectomicrobia bacterium]